MSRILRFAVYASAFFCLFLWGSATWGQLPGQGSNTQHRISSTASSANVAPVTQYTVCTSQGNDDANGYVSAPFETKQNSGELPQGQFLDYIERKFGYEGTVACHTMNSLADAQKFEQGRAGALRNEKKKVVETGWMYGAPEPAAPAAARPAAPTVAATPARPLNTVPRPVATPRPAPQPAPGPAVRAADAGPKYGLCWGYAVGVQPTKPPTAYFSEPFGASAPPTTANVQGWSAAYRQALRSKYGIMSNVHCSAQKSLESAQQARANMSRNWKIVDTGWKLP